MKNKINLDFSSRMECVTFNKTEWRYKISHFYVEFSNDEANQSYGKQSFGNTNFNYAIKFD